MCSKQTRFSNLSRRCTVGNNHFSTCTICLWLILPAPLQVMQAAILWCNFKGKGLVSSWHPSHTRYHAHPKDIPHEHASFRLKGSHARMQTAWFWVEFLRLCVWVCCGEGTRWQRRQVQSVAVIYPCSWTSQFERSSPGTLPPTLT